MTNGDRIRRMTDEELADIIGFNECEDDGYRCPELTGDSHCGGVCRSAFLEWLKQEGQSDDER